MRDFFDKDKFNSTSLCCVVTAQGGGTPNWFVVPTIVAPSGHITYPEARLPDITVYAISLTTCKVSHTILYGEGVVIPYRLLKPLVDGSMKFTNSNSSFHGLSNFLNKASTELRPEAIGSLERIITGANNDTLEFFNSIRKTMSVASVNRII